MRSQIDRSAHKWELWTRLLTLLLVVLASFSSESAASDRKEWRLFEHLQQMVIVDGKRPRLVWLDDQRKSVNEAFFSPTLYQRISRLLLERIALHDRARYRPGDPWRSPVTVVATLNQDIVGVAADSKGTIYLLDRSTPGVWWVDGNRILRKVISGGPLRKPSAIAVLEGRIYVSDPGSQEMFIFSCDTGRLLQEYSLSSKLLPDKLISAGREIIGLNYESKSIFRFFIGEDFGIHYRNEQIFLSDDVVNPVDIAAVGNLIYVLDKGARRLVVISTLGGEATSIGYDGLAEDPIALAVDTAHIVLADLARGTFPTFERVAPVTILLEHNSIPENVMHLYGYLYRRRLLPTRPYVLKKGDSLQSIAVGEEILPAYVEDFDKLVCQLNKKQCKDNVIPLVRGNTISIPALNMSPYEGRRIVSFPLKANRSDQAGLFAKTVGDLVSGPGDWQRQQTLWDLNPSYKGSDILSRSEGAFIIPVDGAVRISALVSAKRKSKLPRLLKGKAEVFYPLSDSARRHGPLGATPESNDDQESLPPMPSAPNKVLPLPTNVPSHGKQPPTCRPIEDRLWNRVLDIVHYCIPTGPETPNPTDIGVVDFQFNSSHPEFRDDTGASRLSVYQDADSKTRHEEVFAVPKTKSATPSFDLRVDHGTHVSALIGAHGKLGQMIGVHPDSLIHAVKVEDFPTAVSSLKPLHIYSLSLGEKELVAGQHESPFRGWLNLMKTHEEVLFVVAAGNSGQQVPPEHLAAGGELSNVIVVAAATLPSSDEESSSLWPDSDRGKEFVSIVAPGQNLKSALFDGGYGVATGTSQATALVAGAAAVLLGTNPDWRPWQLKERLVATSDLDGWIGQFSGTVFGGMLNIQKAVSDTKHTVIRFHDDGRTCKGQITAESQWKPIIIHPQDNYPHNFYIQYSDIRRIVRNKDQFSFTIIYSFAGNPDNQYSYGRSLKRLLNVHASQFEGAPVFQFTPAEGCADREIDIRKLDELINRFY